MLVVAIFLACLGGYILGQKKFNMAFLSIGVDYVQVLALFAGSDIRWPSWVRTKKKIMTNFPGPFFTFQLFKLSQLCYHFL